MAKNNGHQHFTYSLGIPTAPPPYLGNIPKKKKILTSMCDGTGDWEQMHEARQDGAELGRGEERLQRGGSGSGRGQFDHDDGKGLLDNDDDYGGDYGFWRTD